MAHLVEIIKHDETKMQENLFPIATNNKRERERERGPTIQGPFVQTVLGTFPQTTATDYNLHLNFPNKLIQRRTNE